MATRRVRFVARGQKLKVVGRVKPFVAGQVAVLEIARRGKVISRHRARIRRARRGGAAIFRIKASRRGRFSVRLRHRATPQQEGFPLQVGAAQGRHLPRRRGRQRHARAAAPAPPAPDGLRGAGVGLLRRGHLARGAGLPQDEQHVAHRVRQPRGLRQALPQQGCLQAEVPARRAPRGVRLVAPGARADGSQRPAGERLPLVVGQAVHAHGVRQVQLLPQAAGHQLARHGAFQLLHRRATPSTATCPCRRTRPAMAVCGCRSRTPARSTPSSHSARRSSSTAEPAERSARGFAPVVHFAVGLRQGVGEQQAAESEEQEARCAVGGRRATHTSPFGSTMPGEGREEDVVGVIDQLAGTRVHALAQALHAGLREPGSRSAFLPAARALLPLSAQHLVLRVLLEAVDRRTARNRQPPEAKLRLRRSEPAWPWPYHRHKWCAT